MTIVFSRRAVADLDQIASYYTALTDPRIADAVGARIRDVIARVAGARKAPGALRSGRMSAWHR